MGASKTSYTKGRSGNPSGRPVGAVGKLTMKLRKASEKILPLVIEKAESGDFEAQKFLLSLALPKPKPLPIEPSTESYQHSGSVRSSAAAAGLRFAQHGGRYGRGAGVARWCR